MSLKTVFIKSGESYLATNGDLIQTTLGSCVSVCVFDRRLKIGGMIHFLLPNANVTPSAMPNESTNSPQDPLNFGNHAIRHLLRGFKEKGSNPKDLEIAILGGLLTDPASVSSNSTANQVALANVAMADQELARLGLHAAKRVVNSVGKSLQVRFNSASGEINYKLGGTGESKASSSHTRHSTSQKPATSLPSSSSASPAISISGKVKVLVVDDSNPVRMLLTKVLGENPRIEVVGAAADAFEAEELRKRFAPDVMTLDLHMPKKDGLSYLRELMAEHPMPVILVSDLSIKDASPVMRALDLGAFDYIQKPAYEELAEMGKKLCDLVFAGAQAKARIKKLTTPLSTQVNTQMAGSEKPAPGGALTKVAMQHTDPHCRLLAIGASTGGTNALRDVFLTLPGNCPPIVIVQHMPPVFTKAFADSLNKISQVEVKEAEHGDVLEPGHAYLAPGGTQMRIGEKASGVYFIEIIDAPPVNRFKPSVDFMFLSLAKLKTVGAMKAAILTGMGEDGARGLRELKDRGAWTIAQDEASSVVFGMPKAAIEMNGASLILPLNEIATGLTTPRSVYERGTDKAIGH